MKTPAECEALKKELKIEVTEDILQRLEKMLAKNCERPWCASFAWSVLVLVHAHEKLGTHAELLGRAAWLCCAPIQSHEFELTLRPFDFDKLLSNLLCRFLGHIESVGLSISEHLEIFYFSIRGPQCFAPCCMSVLGAT